MTLDREVRSSRTFSLAQSPFNSLLRRLHLLHANGEIRAIPLVVVAWLPLCIGVLSTLLLGERRQAMLFDLSVHVRLLLGIPIVVFAEHLLDVRCRGAITMMYENEIAERTRLDPIIDRAERLRDSRVAAVVIITLAILAGEAVLWGVTGSTGVVAGVAHARDFSFANLWYSGFALPLVQFLLLRWLWHWVIWSYIVLHLSRLPLATTAMHPDHAAGLAFLAGPISAFSSFLFGASCVLSSAWGTQILHGGATMQGLIPSFVVFVAIAVVVACGPQLAYIGQLYNARYRETWHYHTFSLEYVRDFRRKWLVKPASDELGSPDIQSLNDLGGAYGTLEKTRLLPIGRRMLVAIVLSAVIPMLPLAATAVPLTQLLKRVGSAMLGGLPL